MKKFILLFVLMLSSLGVYAQRYYSCHYHRPRVMVRHVQICQPIVVEREVIVVEKKPIVTQRETVRYEREVEQTPQCLSPFNESHEPMFNITQNVCGDDMWDITILFKEDSHVVKNDQQLVLLQNVGEFMQTHPKCRITIYGCASKKHGTYEYNKMLGRNRCIGVKQYLVHNFGISDDRIEMIVRGTDDPRYLIDKWNRCVVIKGNNR